MRFFVLVFLLLCGCQGNWKVTYESSIVEGIVTYASPTTENDQTQRIVVYMNNGDCQSEELWARNLKEHDIVEYTKFTKIITSPSHWTKTVREYQWYGKSEKKAIIKGKPRN